MQFGNAICQIIIGHYMMSYYVQSLYLTVQTQTQHNIM